MPQAFNEDAPLALDTYLASARCMVLRSAALLSEPETDKKNQDKRGHSEVRYRYDFDPYFANGRNVIVYIRIAIKESVTVAKDISAE